MELAKTCIVASQRAWNADLVHRLAARTNINIVAAADPVDLAPERLAQLRPRYIFFAHWSTRIPDAVWSQYECVIFHMTDVPYGRGGSPLQNLIVRGHESTMISALRCIQDLDAGPVYLKQPLRLDGSAEEIFLRADRVIEQMILEIVQKEPLPTPQTGEPVLFKRRHPRDGDLRGARDLEQWYDMIRMLDAQAYPRAYLDVGDFRIEFSRVGKRVGGLVADVVIRERREEDEI